MAEGGQGPAGRRSEPGSSGSYYGLERCGCEEGTTTRRYIVLASLALVVSLVFWLGAILRWW